jgi:hypothetical protein
MKGAVPEPVPSFAKLDCRDDDTGQMVWIKREVKMFDLAVECQMVQIHSDVEMFKFTVEKHQKGHS